MSWSSHCASPPKNACSSPIPTTPPPCPPNRASSRACFDSSVAQALLVVCGAHIEIKAHEPDCFCYCPIMLGGARQPLRGARRQLMFKNDLLKDRAIFLSGGVARPAPPQTLPFAPPAPQEFDIGPRAGPHTTTP